MLRPALLTLCLLLSSTLAIASYNSNPSEAALRYIEEYKTIAINEMERSGIPASIKLAQAIHESSWGRGSLALSSNNFFGIKCKEEWTGRTVYKEDDDYRGGKLIKSCFRAYNSIDESFQDHSNFLLDNIRYERLFRLERTDYVGWARGLKACGYATDARYAEKLIRTIEEYELYKLDVPEVNLSNLIVAPEMPEVLPQDTVIPNTVRQYDNIPAAVRLPDNYVRNSHPMIAETPPSNTSSFEAIEAEEEEVFVEQYADTAPAEEINYEAAPTNYVPEEPAPAQAPEYNPVPAAEAIPEPAPAIEPVEQTTARQAPAAAAAPRYSINPTVRTRVNKSNKRKSQTLQKSRTPQLSSNYRRR